MVRRPFLPLLLAATVVSLSCGEIPEPEGFTVMPSTTAVVGGATSDAAPAPEALASRAPSPPLPTEFVPRAPDGYEPEILMAADSGVLVSAGGAAASVSPLLNGSGAARAFDDLLGGVVLQEAPGSAPGDAGGGTADDAPDADIVGEPPVGPVVWLPAQGADPVVMDDSGGRLLDVGYSGGSPTALVLRPDQQLDAIRLVDGAASPLLALAPDEQLLSLSAAGGLHAVVLANAQCGDLRFYSADGDRLPLPGPGEPDCIVPRRAAYGAVALAPDGGVVAYTVISYRNDGIEAATELRIRDLDSGQDIFGRRIGEDGDRITALSFDGERVVYLRQSPASTTVTVLGVIGTSTERPLELPAGVGIRSVAFTRLALAVG